MDQGDNIAIFNVLNVGCVFSARLFDCPPVIVIAVRIESNLLF
jgi:hypothetical protein